MRLIILSMLALVTVARLAPADDAQWDEAMLSFEEDFKKKSIRFKKRAIEALPLNDQRTIDFIVKGKHKLLTHKNWWIRVTSAERLSKIKNPELRKKLHAYAKNSDKRVREGILTALSMSHDRLDPPIIIEALKDKAWEVRRMACWAAGQQRIPEAVDTMIDMIHYIDPRDGRVIQEGETHPRVRSVLLFNLQEITGEYFHTDVVQWKQYWDRNRDKTLPKVKRFDTGTFGDVKLVFNDTFARKGSGPLVIALPMQLKSYMYYLPYFNQWLFVKWVFINLPPLESFPDVERDDDGDIIYPVSILVDAFEEMRKKRGVEKMVLLGQGFTCWVVAKYAQKYPDRVSGLIMLNPYASNETFHKRIEEARRTGDPDAEFWAKVSSKQIKPASRIEGEVYDYYRTTAFLGLKVRDDVEIAMLRRIWRDPNAVSITIPQFDIRGEETSRAPCLMFFAHKDNELTGDDDFGRLRRYYPNNVIVKLKRKSARLPFMQEPEKFEKALRVFVDKKISK